ncbi:MAG: hypothetical protein QM765_39015 [Myxococcales bacterium]
MNDQRWAAQLVHPKLLAEVLESHAADCTAAEAEHVLRAKRARSGSRYDDSDMQWSKVALTPETVLALVWRAVSRANSYGPRDFEGIFKPPKEHLDSLVGLALTYRELDPKGLTLATFFLWHCLWAQLVGYGDGHAFHAVPWEESTQRLISCMELLVDEANSKRLTRAQTARVVDCLMDLSTISQLRVFEIDLRRLAAERRPVGALLSLLDPTRPPPGR